MQTAPTPAIQSTEHSAPLISLLCCHRCLLIKQMPVRAVSLLPLCSKVTRPSSVTTEVGSGNPAPSSACVALSLATQGAGGTQQKDPSLPGSNVSSWPASSKAWAFYSFVLKKPS